MAATTATGSVGGARRGRRGGVGRLLIVGLAMVLLAGCNAWTHFGFGPENTRYNPDEQTLTRTNVDTLTEIWSRPAQEATSLPIVSDGRAFVSSFPVTSSAEAGDLLALDTTTGDELWRQTLPAASVANGRFYPSPTLSGSDLRIGTGTTFSRYDPATGALLGQVATGQPVHSAIVSGSGVVAMLMLASDSTSPVLHVRDPQTSALRFRAQIPDLGGARPRPLLSIGGDKIYVISAGRIYAFAVAGCGQRTCQPLWVAGQSGTIYNPPLVVGNTVLVGSTDSVSAYRADTGAPLWRHQVGPSPMFLAAADGVVYTTVAGWLSAFDADGCGAPTCDPLWSARLDWTGSPSIANGVVYVGTLDAIAMFDADGCGTARCTPIATEPVEGDVLSISVAEGKVFTWTSQPSTIAAYAPAN
jgi:outer membrane protein assembly factor BamB